MINRLKHIAQNGGYAPGKGFGFLGAPFSYAAKDLVDQAKEAFVQYNTALATYVSRSERRRSLRENKRALK